MGILKLQDLYFKPYLHKDEIKIIVKHLALQVKRDLPKWEVPIFVGILNGCFLFAADFIREFNPNIIHSIIYTDISRDGSLQGVSLDQTINFSKSVPHSVIASGGVSSIKDIIDLSKQVTNGIEGVVIGRALYDKKFTFCDAMKCLRVVT